MIRNYFDKHKRKMFPLIEDFTDPMDHIRNSNKIKSMKYHDWFWYHPSAYNLLNFGINAIGVFMALIASIYILFWFEYKLILIITGILFAANAKELHTKTKNYKYAQNTSFYDMWIRDYPEDKVLEVKHE